MMDFLERILRRPRLVLTVMAILLIGGVSAYMSLPKESFPAVDIPYFYVSVSDTGVSPHDVERLIAKPVEDRLQDLDGLKTMTTTSETGHLSVFLEFNVNANKDKALSDIRAKLDGVSNDLPDEATTPSVTAISFTDIPVVDVAVYGNVPERTLVQHAKDLRDELKTLPDVQDVTLSGARDEMMEVQIDLTRLEAYGLTSGQLLDALSKNNMSVPAGTLDTGQGSFNVKVPGLITNVQDVYNLPIKTDGNTVVTFGDVATITRTFKDATTYANVNGKPAITLGVTKKIGANVIEVSDAVRAKTGDFTASWPEGIQHSFLLDQSTSTKNLYRSLEAAVLTAIALVMTICVAVLGVRAAIMIGTSIPISFMMAFLVVQMMGLSINMMIMFGLVIAVGVLVDDPIVVVEYAERKLSEGYSKREAFILSARKMFVPVVSATATTLGAFVPLLFWPGIIGKFMSYLPIIVIVVMSASLISALIFMPVIGSIIARRHSGTEEEKEAADVVMYPEKFELSKVRGLTGHYVRAMSKLLHYPLVTLPIGFALIAAAFVAYAMHPTGSVAFPPSEPEYGTIAVVARGNYSPVQVRDFMLEVEDKVMQVPGIEDVIMSFGGGHGIDSANTPPDTIGTLRLQLQDWKDRLPADQIFTKVRQKVADISGLEVQILPQQNGPPAGKDINLRVESSNYADLAPAVGKLRNYIENQLGDTVDVEDGRPSPGIDWQINIDRVAAAKYGIGVRDLSPYIQLITNGVKIGSYRPDDVKDELDIRVRLPDSERSFAALDQMRIQTSKGLVPVSNFITRKAVPKVGNITRRNQVFAMNVAANVTPGVLPSEKIKQLQAWQKTQTWPSDVKIVYGGAAEQTNDTNAFIVKAFGAAMFLIFFVLLMEYNSFYQVFVTLSTVIMSTAGVLVGLMVTGMEFSAIMTGLGIVALAGIVVKNGIVLIDTYNHYTRIDGVEPIKAMLLTTAQRIRPVLLTATVTALGVIPMALNVEFDFIRREITVHGLAGQWFVNLSAALVSGLFASTLLTLVMVPVMIVAPSVLKHQLGAALHFLAHLPGAILNGMGLRKRRAAPAGTQPQTAEGQSGENEELVETEKDGVTVVSRHAAE